VLLASSDLYHGESYDEANRVDSVTVGLMAKFAPEAFHAALERDEAQACGGNAITVMMVAARELGADTAVVLTQTNSNDVTGERGGYCVGYSAVAFVASGKGSTRNDERGTMNEAGVSLFGDDKAAGKLSKLALQYIGGILNHAPSLCALTNPSTNSYRRLVPGYEAPVLVFFSFANRTAAIRIPGYVTAAAEMAVEYRIPDATANPYLSMAAILMAGLDGIRSKTDPGAPLKGRLDSVDLTLGKKAVPFSLVRALDELKKDRAYLTQDEVFSDETVDKWVEMKMGEVEAVARRPHPWEFSLYYGC